jgi:hypothetical protein
MNKEIVINNNFSTKSYTKAALNVVLPKWLFWVSVILYSILFINGIRMLIIEMFSNQFTSNNLMKTEIYAIFFPLFLYFVFSQSIKNKLKKDLENKENICYILNNDFFEIKGDSFITSHSWKDLLRINEVKDFFLVFITKNSFLIINKSDLRENQYNELKELFNSLDIKKSLKN